MNATMNDSGYTNMFRVRLSDRDFRRLSGFIQKECGIRMPDSKKILLESRLQKRLRLLGLSSFSAYCDYLFSPAGLENEVVHMIDVVTTNKTDFYREPRHFEFLVRRALPELMTKHGAGINRNLMLWSAGCSTGEEPYTLAMVLSEFARKSPGLNFRYMILATDISTRALEKARKGIYEEERASPVPLDMKKQYLLRGRNRNRGLVRIVPELRAVVKFRRLNFLEDFRMREYMDVIFCRNVIIYFERQTQEMLLNKFCRRLCTGGYLFIGHSETLNGLDLPLVQVEPTVYRKEH